MPGSDGNFSPDNKLAAIYFDVPRDLLFCRTHGLNLPWIRAVKLGLLSSMPEAPLKLRGLLKS